MKTVLFVDDDVRVTKAQKLVMRKTPDVKVVVVNNVKSALDLVSQVDLVVTDWQMPDGGGKAVVDKCQEMDTKVMVCSGSMPSDTLDISITWLDKSRLNDMPTFVHDELFGE